MGRKTDSKRSRLIAVFAVILAAVGALVLTPKPALADDSGTLTITKKSNVEAGGAFTVTLPIQQSQYSMTIDGQPTSISQGATSVAFELTNGQVATINGITPADNGSEFTVTETQKTGQTDCKTYVKYSVGTDTPTAEEKLECKVTLTTGKSTGDVTFYNMVPTIETTVSPREIKPTSVSQTAVITDTVRVTGLVPNKTYAVVGELKQGDTTVASKTVDNVATDDDGVLVADVEYSEVPVGTYAGKDLVAYATVNDGNDPVVAHDKAVDSQTVKIAEIPGSLSITKMLKTPTTDNHIANPTGETDEEKAADKKKWETRKEKAQNQLNDAKPAFTFTVELKDASGKALEDEYKYSGAAEGTVKNGGTISIPATELDSTATITIEGLPEGATYNVTEVDTEGYKAINNKKSDTGTIEKGKTAVADFTNAPLGSLKVIKNVKVTVYDAELEVINKTIEETQKQMDETTDSTTREAYQTLLDEENKYKEELEKKKAELEATEFTFTITLTDADKKALTETKEYKTVKSDGTTNTDGTIKFEDGKSATVKLKGGETIVVSGMDPDYNVSVAETPVDGWVANHKSLSGPVIEGVPLTATFENTYNGTDNPTPSPGGTPSSSTTKSSTKLANTADPVVDAALIAAASAPAVLSGLALRRRK